VSLNLVRTQDALRKNEEGFQRSDEKLAYANQELERLKEDLKNRNDELWGLKQKISKQENDISDLKVLYCHGFPRNLIVGDEREEQRAEFEGGFTRQGSDSANSEKSGARARVGDEE